MIRTMKVVYKMESMKQIMWWIEMVQDTVFWDIAPAFYIQNC